MKIPFPRSLTSVTMAGPEYAYPSNGRKRFIHFLNRLRLWQNLASAVTYM
jgi:hypothetical protein